MANAAGRDVILKLMTSVSELKQSMHEQTESMVELHESMVSGMAKLSSRMKSNELLFGRLAKLLGEYAQQTKGRFDELEERVERLEHAAGK